MKKQLAAFLLMASTLIRGVRSGERCFVEARVGEGGLSGAEISSLTNWWGRLNWARAFNYAAAAWLAGLDAMTKRPAAAAAAGREMEIE